MVSAGQQSPETSFLQLPWQQHNAYQQHRKESELGRIFGIANSIHDDIDAVVVLGSESLTLAARALMQACCDPYHNELSRADRGSKPRMYFCDHTYDSDAISTLINRLATCKNESNGAAGRWALIVISDSSEKSEFRLVAEKFVATLRTTLESEAQKLMPRFVVPITKQTGWLRDLANTVPCEIVLGLPDSIPSHFATLSPQSLLPAALLGLDCMKLLGGAHEMTKHFAEVDFAENAILQFVAVNHLLRSKHNRRFRALKLWSSAMSGIQRWYQQSFPALNFASSVHSSPHHVIHQLIVQTPRCDRLMIGQERDVHSLCEATIADANHNWLSQQQPTTKITLPDSDFVAVGELLQFLMIASKIETELIRKS